MKIRKKHARTCAMAALGRCEAIVFLAWVPPVREVVGSLGELLSDAERERSRQFALEKDASLFITAHALLRYALWRATAVADWQFSVGPFGKPELSPPFGSPRLRFNLSHSSALAACAICHGYDIGVDVEAVDDGFQYDEVAASVFTAHERAQLASCPAASRSTAFLRMWSLKEALMKATGHGFSLPQDSFEISLEPLGLSSLSDPSMTFAQWHVEQRRLTERHWACVAIRRPAGTAFSVEWRPVGAAEIIRTLNEKGGVPV